MKSSSFWPPSAASLSTKRRQYLYGVDRLRVVYTDLLQHIDVNIEQLGPRRRASEEDVQCHFHARRFLFRKSLLPSPNKVFRQRNNQQTHQNEEKHGPTKRTDASDPLFVNEIEGGMPLTISFDEETEWQSRDASNTTNNSPMVRSESSFLACAGSNKDDALSDLAGAFTVLAATRSPDRGAVPTYDDDGAVNAMSRAKALEKRVVHLISSIGNIVVNSAKTTVNATSIRTASSAMLSVRTDSVFEYFCEKSILSLLVDIVKEKRYNQASNAMKSNNTDPAVPSPVHGVVWSAAVKAQVYQTVSLLISDVRNQSILYYLLSNNHINEIIEFMQPIQQWTEPAIEKMLPPYVDLLKNLTLQLADDPHLFPFLTIECREETANNEVIANTVHFPLFMATLQTASSYYAQTDSQIYATCLAIIINLMQIPYRPLQEWMNQSTVAQRALSDHLCERLLNQYDRISYLTTGPVVDGIRHNAIANQLANLKDHMGIIHEVFWSGVRGLDVRLCESLLQRLVAVLLTNLTPAQRPFLVVGVFDADVIPETEALAQVSTMVLLYLFSTLAYIPLQRMLAVAILHPKSTPLWTAFEQANGITKEEDSYVIMPALSDIVNKEFSRQTCPNQFRNEILNTLQGEYGEWRSMLTACLLQTVLSADAMDAESLLMLQVLSGVDNDPTTLELAVFTFLTRSHPATAISAQALESTGLLGLMLLYNDLMLVTASNETKTMEERLNVVLAKSPVWSALLKARDVFCTKALEYREVTGVSDLFLDLMEAAIQSRYTARYNESNASPTRFTCLLNRRGNVQTLLDADSLVRQTRGVTSNDVEATRFFMNMGLHFRALCKVIDRLCLDIVKSTKDHANTDPMEGIQLDLVDKADDLSKIIGGLSEKPHVGAELDLSGRMFFPFRSTSKLADRPADSSTRPLEKSHGNGGVFDSMTQFLLVLDPTDLFVVKPAKKMEENRGTVLFSISLRSIIAAAVDVKWLHMAVRCPDVGFLIKNGNMAMKFESAGTCLIVQQYLDRSREVLRRDLMAKIPQLLTQKLSCHEDTNTVQG